MNDVRRFIVPASGGLAFEVLKGQKLKIIEVEGKQVADFNAFNLHNFRERFSASLTRSLNRNLSRISKGLYSNTPYENLMFSVVKDTVGAHWLGHRCSKILRRSLDPSEVDTSTERTCQDNLANAIKPYGLEPDDVHDVLAIFQHEEVDSNHHITIAVPLSNKGDYLELLAMMDTLVAISACPSTKATNDFLPKPVGIEISE